MSIKILPLMDKDAAEILTDGALKFIEALHRQFIFQRFVLTAKNREIDQRKINQGVFPNFTNEELRLRADKTWTVDPYPKDLADRRVEITGPASDRKMFINALNSGANVYMADLEDSMSPTWSNIVKAQINIKDAVRNTISFTSPEGKEYKLKDKVATLMVRPRGWHLSERHVLIDGPFAFSASLFDFGLALYHNAHELIKKGSGPYFYLPKIESALEARLWNQVFDFSETYLNLPKGSIKATVLIETITAAFQMEQILYELRHHSVGLNCGRWDYIFSFIKKFNSHPSFTLPDRAEITMDKGFLDAYVRLLIQTCHTRGTHAMGGMAAQVPIKNNPEANAAALAKVRADKTREVLAGHDGTWVAHPDLVSVAKEIFDKHMPEPNQINKLNPIATITAHDLLALVEGSITEAGLRNNINIAIRYIEPWLRGVGCVQLNYLMEDAATAEISRSQVWQWLQHKAKLVNGTIVTKELVERITEEEIAKIKATLGDKYADSKFESAKELFVNIATAEEFIDFLTVTAYNYLLLNEGQ